MFLNLHIYNNVNFLTSCKLFIMFVVNKQTFQIFSDNYMYVL